MIRGLGGQTIIRAPREFRTRLRPRTSIADGNSVDIPMKPDAFPDLKPDKVPELKPDAGTQLSDGSFGS